MVFKKKNKGGILLRGPRRAAPHGGLPQPELTGEILQGIPPPHHHHPRPPQTPRLTPEVPHSPPDGAKPPASGGTRPGQPGEGSPVPGDRARWWEGCGEKERRGETGPGEVEGHGGARFGSFHPSTAFLRDLPRRRERGAHGGPGDTGARLPEGCTGCGGSSDPAYNRCFYRVPASPEIPPLEKGLRK